MNVVSHVSEEDLEQYAMHTLRESACATLEEHLLICSQCRERLEAEDRAKLPSTKQRVAESAAGASSQAVRSLEQARANLGRNVQTKQIPRR